jgi:hypothetical protein
MGFFGCDFRFLDLWIFMLRVVYYFVYETPVLLARVYALLPRGLVGYEVVLRS